MVPTMNSTNFEVKCLQKHPEYFEQTITLLNNQWPRSRTARLRSLEQGSKYGLPTSLVLVDKRGSDGEETVIAHSKISSVPHQAQLCFVESVVVAPELRGKGLGRLIMQETEEYVKKLGVTIVYLTTFDQQHFYRRLGYDFASPIVVFGGNSKLADKTDNFSSLSNMYSRESESENHSKVIGYNDSACVNLNEQNDRSRNLSTCAPPPPPPPPPPPSIKIVSNNNNSAITASKLTMRKFLTS